MAASAIAVKQDPEGWTGFVPAKLMLHGVGISTGALEDRATLLGDYRKLKRGAFTVTYSSLRGWADRERWLMCQYGDGGDIVLATRLPHAVDTCVISYARDRYGDRVIKIACT